MLDFYLTLMKVSVLEQLQYPVANYFYMIGMIAEPVIYLVVWSTVARAQGGEVGGYTPGAFAAYYIVWTLVRNMNIVFTPYGWEWRIQQGRLSMELLRPIHPLHGDVAFFAGWKIVVIILWLPLAAFLSLIFKPDLHPSWLEILVFFFAIWGAYLIRTMLLSLLGMITFWTTRVGAIFELFFALELVLSGRLVPMSLMPAGAAGRRLPALPMDLRLPHRSPGRPAHHLAAHQRPGHAGAVDRHRPALRQHPLENRHPPILGSGRLKATADEPRFKIKPQNLVHNCDLRLNSKDSKESQRFL
jgi:ABC-2 type transport system permease protein